MKRTLTTALLITVGTVGLAGCSSGSSPSAPPSPAASATTTTPAETTSPTRAAGSSTDEKTGTTVADCLETQLRATIDPRHVPGNGTLNAQGATKKGVVVDFQNTSKTTCKLTGYPGAATVNAAGGQVTQATRTLRGDLGGLPDGITKFSAVILAPGHYADAMIEGVDQKKAGAAQAGCADSLPRILVTPPNTRIPVPFTVSWPACFSFDIHPVGALTDAP